MIRDLQREQPPADFKADVCVVGAGAAGIILTLELLRLGKSVVLLEAGGDEIEDASQDPYASEVTGLPHRGVHVGRFRAKGGTTTRWGGQILELDEGDFARREWVAGSGWPFRKAELTDRYARALELEGLGRVLRHDSDVWQSIGQAEPGFADMEMYFSRWCPEPNFARLHDEVLRNAPGLTVWLHGNAVELLLEDERAAGVRCLTLTGVESVFKADEYCFCLGTIESSRFFLQPREGELPWNPSGMLGRHFQDHVDANGARVVPRSPGRFHEVFDNVFVGGYKYHPKLRLDAEVQKRLRTLNVAGTMYFLSDADEALDRMKGTAKHLLRGRFSELSATDAAGLLKHLPLLLRQSWRYGVQHRAYVPADATIMLRVHCEQEPLSASSISLAESRDALGMLRTRLDWRISKFELDTIRAYVEAARLALHGLAEVIPDAALTGGDEGFLQRCDDSNHHMGGMRMAESAAEGVVDPNLRLHGTRNVFVLSGAVFPTSGFSNPTHTLLALAVRLAEHLS